MCTSLSATELTGTCRSHDALAATPRFLDWMGAGRGIEPRNLQLRELVVSQDARS